MLRREELSCIERFYILQVLQGVVQTAGDLIKHLFVYLLNVVGIRTKQRPWATIEYPDAVRPYPPQFRGRHRLTLNPDGSVRCTACFLCATACPARCIYIEPEEHPDPRIEKFPRRYEIDTLLCIYCGYCVDACPVDAIRMDTGIHPKVYSADPRAFIEDKETLTQRSRDLQEQGVARVMEQHLARIRALEKAG